MNELSVLRQWLNGQTGRLNEIAKRTGISRRTIQRIVNDDEYSVHLSTYSILKSEMDRSEIEQVA